MSCSSTGGPLPASPCARSHRVAHGANACAQRFVCMVRSQVTDRMLIANEWHLRPTLQRYVRHDNGRRPHWSLHLQPPRSDRPFVDLTLQRGQTSTRPLRLDQRVRRHRVKTSSALVKGFGTLKDHTVSRSLNRHGSAGGVQQRPLPVLMRLARCTRRRLRESPRRAPGCPCRVTSPESRASPATEAARHATARPRSRHGH
jgi:hypothetical protein